MRQSAWFPFLVVTLLAIACVRQPQQATCERADLSGCVIEDVNITGNQAASDDDIEERIATAETRRLLGGALENVPILSVADRLSVEYEYFDRFVLERDLARIERYYRSLGYYEAQVRAGRVARTPEGRVRVEIAVSEGPPVRVGEVDLKWKDWRLPDAAEVTKPVTDAKNSLRPGSVFREERYEETKRRVLREMTDRGFAYATVSGQAHVDLTTHRATIVLTLELGPHSRFGPITFEGLGEIPEDIVRDAIGFKEGDEFSTAALDSAEYALSDFGVFGSIHVVPNVSPPGTPPNPVVPVTFKVQPAALRQLKFGLGAEIGQIAELHFVNGWEHKNLFGGLRRFQIEAKPGLVLHGLRISDLDEPPERVLPEMKATFQLKQPLQYIDPRTSAFLRGAFALAADRASITKETSYILAYRTYEGTFGLERLFWNSQVYVSPSSNIALRQPFSYSEVETPPGFSSLVIPWLELNAELDIRLDEKGKRDRATPNSGVYVANQAQMAGHFLGGDADDFRLRSDVRTYVPISRRVTLALRFVGGFLFAQNYGDSLADRRPAPERLPPPTRTDETAADVAERLRPLNAFARDSQIVAQRGFSSGGPYSNRGYAFGAIAPHAFLCTSGCTPEEVLSITPRAYALQALAGPLLWEASAEVRLPISGNFGTAIFVDASDVPRTIELRLTHPHLSAGFGLRYATPVGPIRADLGFRIPCLQIIDPSTPGCDRLPQIALQGREVHGADPATRAARTSPGVLDDAPEETIFGLPMNISISIGEAF